MNGMSATRLFALLGHPVAHSHSPFIMNRAFAMAGIDAAYVALPVPARGLEAALDGLSILGAGGANVTYPYKETVAARLGDALSPDAALLGAVNTLVARDGAFTGHNTDAPGTAVALGVDAKGERVFIFGVGGAARAAALGLLRAGAAAVTLGARSPQTARAAVAPLATAFPACEVAVVAWDEARVRVRDAAVVINATPLGMAGTETGDGIVAEPAWIEPHHCCVDFVYHPRRTPFLEAARARGARTVDGLALLVAQAAVAFELWTGQTFDTAGMLSALEEDTIA